MTKTTIFLIAVLLLFFISCDKTKSSGSGVEPVIQEGVTPVADEEIAVIEMENADAFGAIKIELYSNIAPKMVARFKELALRKEGWRRPKGTPSFLPQSSQA